MNWFYNMKIGKKLVISFVIVSLLAGVVGIVGISNLNKIDRNYTKLYQNYGIPLGELGLIGMNFHNGRTLLRSMLTTDSQADLQRYIDQIKTFDKEYEASMAIFESTIDSDEMRQSYNQLDSQVREYMALRDEFISLISSGQTEQAISKMNEAQAVTSQADQMIRAIFAGKNDDGRAINDELTTTTRNAVYMMLAVIIIAMLVAIGLGLFTSRIISNPVRQLVHNAGRIADGDLDVAVPISTKDEIGQLADAFGKMTDNLNDVMASIRSASEQVASGAKQMSESSILLSQGATEQASSVEQLTVSLEEVATKIGLNTDNAMQATDKTATARDNALQGNERMKEMLVAMDDINASSNNISKIIKVIDEIAFQTNILALNAAVEAARAGQHGKGFAVVAEEVRNLAARSANAAKETTEMIEGSIRKVEGGMKIANETAAALGNIVQDITLIAQLAKETAEASTEQSVGVSQINQGLLQVSQVIQTNSATSEESAAASEELTGQAEMLKEQVNRFKLRSSADGSYSGNYQGGRSYGSYAAAKAGISRSVDEDFAKAAAGMEPIVISDKEFGKY